MDIQITTFQHTCAIADIEGVHNLVHQQLTFIGYTPTMEDVQAVLANAMKQESRSVLFVAYQHNKALGIAFGNVCCGLESGGDYLWLNELYVAEEARVHGLGTQLLTEAQRWAKEHGCTYFAMVTHPKNERAQGLYAAEGFELENLVWVDKYL
ncbi:GNAT family N-acetyltransferase [Sphaerochaeta globosa]|jgi:GNAT superfamily N-acetyltransferase|uniref:GCN5-related N-acetyltransferase n=1 Tax=Sphaerochaeta globosa (strain ATCC BAA-1886 / DSM 22777 / Buddy) TaxID=158189 RepID=F0RT80_SPHGB|nr:GNAT family N-acetyltransferase [Sphaerochaeta globosa]ADY14385.1 GCN5-related N-acetyltransferase [Sphaerochaeta globosa str. Buddy]